ASSQLVDNQIIGNYYRNNEAFANAESGINFVLSMLDNKIQAGVLLEGLPSNSDEPITITSTASHYQVNIYKNHSRKITIISSGTSMDGTASRNIQLEADFYLDYPIPVAAVSSNGKFNLDETAVVNDGCEGLGMEECLGGRNIADHMLVSNPDFEDDESDLCSGGSVGENVIADGVLLGATTEKIIEETSDGGYDWGGATIPDGSEIAGIPSDPDMVANSLFESTFGIEMSQDNLDDIWDNAATINMTNGGDCSDLLQDVSEEDEIIYIKGDCNISQYYTVQSKTSQNKVFTIGSVEHPKLVFIEGGTFVTAPNTGANIVGMLYFLPSKHDQINDDGDHVLDDDGNRIQVLDTSVDMGGVNVNGALLSEYKCSYNGYDKADNKGTKQHFTTRFDKLVLGNLYSEMGMGATNSGYRLSSGTWRDF
ncbi:MAG: hypothetical protein GY787_08315, partial [Alteromonadales bacterium]|nr:hypothetical protein [Alteromonadales bacterium]